MNTNKKHIGIANYTEGGRQYRLVVTLELCVGDLNGDLAAREFQTVEHEPCPVGTLNFSGTYETIDRGLRRDNGVVSCGASFPDLPREGVTFDDGWTRQKYEELQAFGERWHLNTMRAGCAHMTLPEDKSYDARKGIACENGTGYKYGSAWLVEPLTDDALAYLAALGVEKPENAAT